MDIRNLISTTALIVLAGCSGNGINKYGGLDTDTQDGNGPVETAITIAAGDMIDDLEDGDSQILDAGGRIGYWFTYNDGSAGAEQSPSANTDFLPGSGGADGSSFAAHTSGSGFVEWGAGMSFDFNNPGSNKDVVDASGFTGIAFKAKGNATIYVAVATRAVTSEQYGGTCVPGTGDGTLCDDAHGMYFELSSDTWQQYALDFSQIQQGAWGQPFPFEADQVMSMQFEAAEGVDFDIWVDEIGFYP